MLLFSTLEDAGKGVGHELCLLPRSLPSTARNPAGVDVTLPSYPENYPEKGIAVHDGIHCCVPGMCESIVLKVAFMLPKYNARTSTLYYMLGWPKTAFLLVRRFLLPFRKITTQS